MTSESTSSDPPADTRAKQQGSHESTVTETPTSGATTVRLPSTLIGSSRLHGKVLREEQVTVLLNQAALRQLEDHCFQVLDAEIGGVLLGKFERQNIRNYILVEAILPVQSDDYGPVHFTFTADSWANLHKEKAENFADLDIVGWYHTHPGLGIFYSADDVVVHSAAFVLPWHVGLVIDPVFKQGCFFGWQNTLVDQGEASLKPLAGYYELQDEQDVSVVHWQLSEASVWKPGAFSHPGMRVSDQVYVPANDWPSLPPISPWWGVVLGGISLILTLLILLDRILGLIR
jgi:proteasome lid subunit RPN8/RPN11